MPRSRQHGGQKGPSGAVSLPSLRSQPRALPRQGVLPTLSPSAPRTKGLRVPSLVPKAPSLSHGRVTMFIPLSCCFQHFFFPTRAHPALPSHCTGGSSPSDTISIKHLLFCLQNSPQKHLISTSSDFPIHLEPPHIPCFVTFLCFVAKRARAPLTKGLGAHFLDSLAAVSAVGPWTGTGWIFQQ